MYLFVRGIGKDLWIFAFGCCWISCLSLNGCIEEIQSVSFSCTDSNHSIIPMDLPKSIRRLDLSFNPLRHIHSNNFSNLSNLEYLDLTRCSITVIEDLAFSSLEILHTLVFTGNPISHWAPQSFFGLFSLCKLVVVETSLSTLSELPLRNVSSLREIYAAHNKLKSLHLKSSLVNLQTLDLRDNQITEIKDNDLDLFRGVSKTNLSLILSRNPINYFSPKAFLDINLHKLQIQGCFSIAESLRSNLKALSGSKIEKLEIGDYRSSAVKISYQEDLLEGLCTVDIQELSINGMNFKNTDGLHDCVKNLTSLRVVNNNLELDSSISSNLNFDRLQRLHIKNCALTNMPLLFLSKCPSLLYIQITGIQKLSNLNWELKGLKEVKVLDLSNNQLNMNDCCSQFVAGTSESKIQHLNLSSNLFIGFSSAFINMPHLQSLDVSHSRIQTVGKFPIFMYLANLRFLDLSYTYCNFLIDCSFCGLYQLEELRVSRTLFASEILSVVFQNLTQLRSLDLSECNLEFIPEGTFSSLKVLNVLNLSKNKLLDLRPSHLIQLATLISLDLSFNQLKGISDNSIQSLPSSLAKIDLSGNPFDCSCLQINFLLWVQQQKDKTLKPSNQMFCKTPQTLNGLPLRDYTLSCSMTLLISGVVLGILCPSLIAISVFCYLTTTPTGKLICNRCKKKHDHNYVYDAFVMFSNLDEEWVKQQLVPKLENEGGFILCLHYRDFVPGVPIINNISNSILNSHKVIVVLSQNFLESKWCSYEFEMAKAWQYLEGSSEIIVILLESVNEVHLKKVLGLHKYLAKTTYLERNNDFFFWMRLQNALKNGQCSTTLQNRYKEMPENIL